MLAVASLGTCSAAVADLFCQDQTHQHCHYITIANPSESYDRTVFISHQCEMSSQTGDTLGIMQ